jgi:hypothetical protein
VERGERIVRRSVTSARRHGWSCRVVKRCSSTIRHGDSSEEHVAWPSPGFRNSRH